MAVLEALTVGKTSQGVEELGNVVYNDIVLLNVSIWMEQKTRNRIWAKCSQKRTSSQKLVEVSANCACNDTSRLVLPFRLTSPLKSGHPRKGRPLWSHRKSTTVIPSCSL